MFWFLLSEISFALSVYSFEHIHAVHSGSSQPPGLQLHLKLDFKENSHPLHILGFTVENLRKFCLSTPPFLMFFLSLCNLSNAIYSQRTLLACSFSGSTLKKVALISAKVIELNVPFYDMQ